MGPQKTSVIPEDNVFCGVCSTTETAGRGVNPPEIPHHILVPGMRFFFPARMYFPLIPSFTDPLAVLEENDGKQSKGFLPRHPTGPGVAASASRVCNQCRNLSGFTQEFPFTCFSVGPAGWDAPGVRQHQFGGVFPLSCAQ